MEKKRRGLLNGLLAVVLMAGVVMVPTALASATKASTVMDDSPGDTPACPAHSDPIEWTAGVAPDYNGNGVVCIVYYHYDKPPNFHKLPHF